VPVLIKRIQKRAADGERDHCDYLSLLDSYYEDWLQAFDLCPVLTIRSDDLNFVSRPKHLDLVIERIHEKLSGREEMVLE